MEKNGKVLRKRYSHNKLSGDNIMPRRGRRSSYRIPAKILQDDSLPSMRSLHIDKSMVHHLDSMAATPENMRPQHMLIDSTDVSNITLTPRWKNYLDQTYNLRSAKQSSQKTVSDDSSVPEESGNFEDVLKSPGKQQHFQHRRRNLIPKDVGNELFRAAFTRSTPQRSVILPPEQKRGDEISVEDLEEASLIVSQPFKRRKNVKTNPYVFKDAFEDFAVYSPNSVEVVSNRLEKSSGMKNASASPQRSLRDRSGNRHVQESEQQPDVPSDSASPKGRQPQSTHEIVSHSGQTKNVTNSLTSQSSVILPSQEKGGGEISFEGAEEASPVVSQPFKRRRNVKTNPTVFQAVFEDFMTSAPTSEENVSRHEESSQLNTASSSLQRSQNDKMGSEHFHELEQQSDASSILASSDRRQIQSAGVLPSPSGQTKRVAFTSSTPQSSVVLQQQLKGHNEVGVEGLGEVSTIVSHPFETRGNVKTNPSLFQAALEDFVASSTKYEEDVSNRHKESVQSKNASSSPERAHNDRSGNEHVRELEQQLDVPSNSKSPDRRQMQSTDVLPSLSGQTKNAAFTSPTPQSSVNLPPHLKGVHEMSVESHEKGSPIVSQSFKKRRHEDPRETKNARALASASQRNKETGHVHTLVERSYVLSNSSSSNKRLSEMESMDMHPGVSNGREQNKMQSTAKKSVKPQNVAWFRRWQEKAAATGNPCTFNLLSREERIAKLEEFVRDVKEKHEVAFKSKCTTKISKPEELEYVQIIPTVPKRKVCKKPLRPDLLVDGKPYRPRLKRPKPWATSRLYKLIISKCEEKYGTLKAHRKAEEFVVHLCEKVSTVIRRKKYENYEGILEEIKKTLYRLGVIKCLMEYFVFIEDYLPFEYRIKAVPCLRAYGKNTGPPMAPDTDLFADLDY